MHAMLEIATTITCLQLSPSIHVFQKLIFDLFLKLDYITLI